MGFLLQRFLVQSGRWALAVAMLGSAVPALAEEGEQVHPAEELAAPPVPADAANAADSAPDAALAGEFPLNSAPRIYYPADFTRTNPRTALDMIREIPGFAISGGGGPGGGGGGAGGAGGRGFGEASGNLLLNGDRITSKSSSVQQELARIPASNVVRIEIVDGASLQIPGLSGQVANVIVRTDGLSGQFSWRPQYSTGPAPVGVNEGSVSVRGSTRGLAYTLSLDGGGFIRGSGGPSVFTWADGTVDERYNTQHANFRRPTLRSTLGFRLAPEVRVNLNLSGGLTIFRSFEEEARIPGNPLASFDEVFHSANNERFYELGGDIEFPLGPGDLKLIVLESFEHGNFRTQSLLDLGDLPTSGSLYRRLSDQGERIGRAEYSWPMLGGDWQISGEAAFNRLDNLGRLFLYSDSAGDFVEIPFPAGVGGVREERYESILSYGRPLSSTLTLQLTLGGEYSTISQTGVNALSRTFQRPKGSVSLSWAPAPGTDISLRVARRVGQLNFGDFLASVNLSDENQNSGNNQLRPEQSWESELEVSHGFGDWGSATLALFDHRIEDFLAIVPLAGGGESRGNISSAHRYGLRLNGRLQLAALGWQGAVLDLRLTAEDSSLTDPVTGDTRRFDRLPPFEVRLDFRHDIPQTDWAWGLEFRNTENARSYRVAEVTMDYNVPTFGAVYVEDKDLLGLTVRLRAANLFNGQNVLQRTVYGGPRDSYPVLFTEDRRNAIGQVFNLTVSGTF